ncbi:hypothetical protein [Histophilus somni]|uniref:hypothetical protein n=1 Tax=Histophilus somni TaxID=731 RepID=UPI00201ED9B8|nr:hypothetical protein [Histophilus somni]
MQSYFLNISGQVTVGYGFSASANFNQSKINADYAGVQEQSGIYAGNEGYDVDINNKVVLTGGAILSTAKPDKNVLSARTFGFADIENYSNTKASSIGLGMGFSVGRDQTSKEDKEKNEIYRAERERNGETFKQANPNQANSSPIKFGLGENDVHSADLYALAKIGATNLLSNTRKSKNASSVTSSVISQGQFNIQDLEGQDNIARIQKSTLEQTNRLAQPDYRGLQKEVKIDSAIKRQFFSNMAGLTDEAYRTMFIAEHRMFTTKVDEKGNPIKDPKLLSEINKEADEKGIDREVYRKTEVAKGRNIYQLKEVSDQERENLRQVTYTDPLTGKLNTRYVVAFNGIFNDENAAAKLAVQNYVAGQNPDTGKIDKKLFENLYFVHHPKANNPISEVLVAGYQKMLEGSFNNKIFGMDNSALQAVELMKSYGKDNLYLGSHSRGTLTLSNALTALNTEENRKNKILSGTLIKMVGPAANVSNADNRLSRLQTGSARNNSNSAGSIRIENHISDLVGSMPILLGGNPSTMDENLLNKNKLDLIKDIFSNERSSVHNCYGLGQEQCVTDGYRKKGDLMMNKERTIYDLNKKIGEK